jgi:Domain of unknown function (DUF4386)
MTNTARTSRQLYARLAGFCTLLYIAAGTTSVILYSGATGGDGTAAILKSIAEHASGLRMTVVLELLECFSALVLAVSLYGITRDESHELALLGLVFRVAEGVLGAIGIPKTIGLLWLANGGGSDVTTPLGDVLLMPTHSAMSGSPFFAAGMMVFLYLLLRGRIIPAPLAWFGLIASALLVIGTPMQLAGFIDGPVTWYIWLPMIAFEIPFGLWLLIKGVAAPVQK